MVVVVVVLLSRAACAVVLLLRLAPVLLVVMIVMLDLHSKRNVGLREREGREEAHEKKRRVTARQRGRGDRERAPPPRANRQGASFWSGSDGMPAESFVALGSYYTQLSPYSPLGDSDATTAACPSQ